MTRGKVTRYRLVDGRYRIVHDDPDPPAIRIRPYKVPADEQVSAFNAYAAVATTGEPAVFTFHGSKVVLFDYRDPAWRDLPEFGGPRD